MKRGSIDFSLILFLPLFLATLIILVGFLHSQQKVIQDSIQIQNELDEAHRQKAKRFKRRTNLKDGQYHQVYGEFN